jgi:hypothetical protein
MLIGVHDGSAGFCSDGGAGRRPRRSAEDLLERCARLPRVDPAELRADIDAVIDPKLPQ